MPDRRKGYIQKATIGDHKVYFILVNMKMEKLVKYLLIQAKKESLVKALMNNFAIAVSL